MDLQVLSSISLTESYKNKPGKHPLGRQLTNFYSLCFLSIVSGKAEKNCLIFFKENTLIWGIPLWKSEWLENDYQKSKILKFIKSYTSHQYRFTFAFFKHKETLRIWTVNQLHSVS